MEELIRNNLAQMQLDGDPEMVMKANGIVSIGTMDTLFDQDNDLGAHPCMDGMWY